MMKRALILTAAAGTSIGLAGCNSAQIDQALAEYETRLTQVEGMADDARQVRDQADRLVEQLTEQLDNVSSAAAAIGDIEEQINAVELRMSGIDTNSAEFDALAREVEDLKRDRSAAVDAAGSIGDVRERLTQAEAVLDDAQEVIDDAEPAIIALRQSIADIRSRSSGAPAGLEAIGSTLSVIAPFTGPAFPWLEGLGIALTGAAGVWAGVERRRRKTADTKAAEANTVADGAKAEADRQLRRAGEIVRALEAAKAVSEDGRTVDFGDDRQARVIKRVMSFDTRDLVRRIREAQEIAEEAAATGTARAVADSRKVQG